jgi:hypothetical protein
MLNHHIELHEKLDHIIRHHPDIPTFDDGATKKAPDDA